MSKLKIGCVAIVLVVTACVVSPRISKQEAVTTMSVTIEQPSPSITVPPAPSVEPEPSVPAITLYDVPLSEDLQKYTYETCKANSVDTYYPLVIAVMWHESVFDASVISSTNDYGLMQINKVNHDWLSAKLGITDFLDPEQSIQAGVWMLSKYLQKYEDVDKALMAYNMGEYGAQKRWKKGIYTTNYTKAVKARLEQVLTSELHQTK